MLVLTRRKGEVIEISSPTACAIKLVVIDIRGGRVRIGFGAPDEVQILRPEAIKRTKVGIDE